MHSRSPHQRGARSLITLLLLTILTTMELRGAVAQEALPDAAPRGETCLFAGHSFFIPVARSFSQLARTNDFPGHEMKIVFRGGQSGTAGAIWANEGARTQTTKLLETGDVELLGLTPGLTDSVATFQKWFDLALKHNPDTRFFIGIPWGIGGHMIETARYDQMIDGYARKGLALVEELRTLYPDSRIDYLAYGKIAPAMKARFEAGTLPDIEVMVGPDRNALFRDNRLGHAGPMLLELCALTWMHQIYGSDISTLTYGTHASDVPAIVNEVLAYNAPFNQVQVRDAPEESTEPATPAPEDAMPPAG